MTKTFYMLTNLIVCFEKQYVIVSKFFTIIILLLKFFYAVCEYLIQTYILTEESLQKMNYLRFSTVGFVTDFFEVFVRYWCNKPIIS